MRCLVSGRRFLGMVLLAAALGCRGGEGVAGSVDAGTDGPVPVDAGDPAEVAPAADVAQAGAPAPPVETWTRTFDRGQGYADHGRAVAIGPDGSVVVVGATERPIPPGDLDIWVRKYDAAGVELWTRTFDGAIDNESRDDEAFAVAIDRDGAVVVAGVARQRQLWLRRYDAAGGELWTISGDDGAGRGLALDGQGTIWLTGESIGLRTYDRDGTLRLRKPLPGLEGAALALSPDGGVVVVGATQAIEADLVVRQLSAEGEEVWSRTFDSGGDDRGQTVAVDTDGSVVAGGTVLIVSGGSSSQTLWLRKYDRAGQTLWTDTQEVGSAPSLALDPGGAIVVVAGWSNSFLIRKYAPGGGVLWSIPNQQPGVGLQRPAGLALDGRGGVVITGAVTVTNNVFAVPEDIFVSSYRP
jgi:hypothetical protein